MKWHKKYTNYRGIFYCRRCGSGRSVRRSVLLSNAAVASAVVANVVVAGVVVGAVVVGTTVFLFDGSV